jgi:NADPH:quinone reductase-like Zn-dependent oxidoreductase
VKKIVVIVTGRMGGPPRQHWQKETSHAASIRGSHAGSSSMGTVPIEVKRETFAKLAEYVRQGKFKLPTEVYPLADFRRAWERQKKSPNGKIIIDLKR